MRIVQPVVASIALLTGCAFSAAALASNRKPAAQSAGRESFDWSGEASLDRNTFQPRAASVSAAERGQSTLFLGAALPPGTEVGEPHLVYAVRLHNLTTDKPLCHDVVSGPDATLEFAAEAGHRIRLTATPQNPAQAAVIYTFQVPKLTHNASQYQTLSEAAIR